MTSAPPPDSEGTDPATKENQEGLLREKGELSPVETQTMKEIALKAILWVGVAQEKKVLRKIQRRHYESGRST